jgi:hypothetical protein
MRTSREDKEYLKSEPSFDKESLTMRAPVANARKLTMG